MRFLPAAVVDVVLVLVFAAIGRASHDENPAGFLLTAWPFLVALVLGHLTAALLPGRPRRPWSVLWGVVVWVLTVVGGLLLRIASGDTAQVPFIIVATLTLGVFLVGWRAITALVRRRGAAAPVERWTETATQATVPGESTALATAAEDRADDAPAGRGTAADADADADDADDASSDVPHAAPASDPDDRRSDPRV